MNPIKPFQFDTDPQAITDLHRRLDATRWPGDVNGGPSHEYGMRGGYLRELLAYWRHEFDWPAAQARINGQPQFLLDIDGLPLHFIHARSAHEAAVPSSAKGADEARVNDVEAAPNFTATVSAGAPP